MQRSERRMERVEMKRMSLTAIGIAALGFATQASAADMAARPYKAPPPVMAPIYDWTGFYIGANGGWGEVPNCGDFLNTAGVGGAQGWRGRSGLPRSLGRSHWRAARLSLASQSVCFRLGSSGRLGGSQQPARQPL